MTIEQTCPLCGGLAGYKINHHPIYCKHFYCRTCVEFCIDDESEIKMATKPAEHRAMASVRAKESNADRLFILRAPNAKERALDRTRDITTEFFRFDI